MLSTATGRVDAAAPVAGSTLQVLRSVALVGLLMSWNVAFSAIASHFQLGMLELTPGGLALTVLDLLVQLGLIVGVGCVWLGKASLRELGWQGASLPRLLAWGLLQTALLVALVFAVYAALAGLRGIRGLATAIATIPLSERLVYLIAGAKVAFVEETLFRGDLLGKLAQRTGAVVGVLLSSMLFALFHRTLAPVPLAMKLVLGVIFAVFTLRTRSLIPSALGHWLLWVIVGDN